jgi:hypothetical protein
VLISGGVMPLAGFLTWLRHMGVLFLNGRSPGIPGERQIKLALQPCISAHFHIFIPPMKATALKKAGPGSRRRKRASPPSPPPLLPRPFSHILPTFDRLPPFSSHHYHHYHHHQRLHSPLTTHEPLNHCSRTTTRQHCSPLPSHQSHHHP